MRLSAPATCSIRSGSATPTCGWAPDAHSRCPLSPWPGSRGSAQGTDAGASRSARGNLLPRTPIFTLRTLALPSLVRRPRRLPGSGRAGARSLRIAPVLAAGRSIPPRPLPAHPRGPARTRARPSRVLGSTDRNGGRLRVPLERRTARSASTGARMLGRPREAHHPRHEGVVAAVRSRALFYCQKLVKGMPRWPVVLGVGHVEAYGPQSGPSHSYKRCRRGVPSCAQILDSCVNKLRAGKFVGVAGHSEG
jgi:hypothetical protein